MEQKKNITLLWRKLNSLEFGKDVVLVPYYLGQALGCQVEICCGYSEEIATQISKRQKKDLHFVRRPLGYKPLQRIPILVAKCFTHQPIDVFPLAIRNFRKHPTL